jgi:prepilin-type N-terminal cleavage/methylation domain-containing protein
MRSSKSLKKQAGFTLSELLIVVVIIGVLSSVAYSQFGSATPGVRAKTTYDAAQKIYTSWSVASQQTGVPLTTTSSPLVASGNSALDAVMVGNSPAGVIAAAYQTSFQQSGLRPLSNMGVITTAPAVGAAGAYKIGDYPATMTSATVNGQTVINVVFTTVPTEVVQNIYNSHANAAGAPFNSGTAVSSGHVQYTAAASDGTMTLTIQFS